MKEKRKNENYRERKKYKQMKSSNTNIKQDENYIRIYGLKLFRIM